MDDFIEVYEDALDPRVCAELIAAYTASGGKIKRGETGGGVNTSLKDSWDICISRHQEWRQGENILNTAVMRGPIAYVRKYAYLALAPLFALILAGYLAADLYPGFGLGPVESLRRTWLVTAFGFLVLASVTFAVPSAVKLVGQLTSAALTGNANGFLLATTRSQKLNAMASAMSISRVSRDGSSEAAGKHCAAIGQAASMCKMPEEKPPPAYARQTGTPMACMS